MSHEDSMSAAQTAVFVGVGVGLATGAVIVVFLRSLAVADIAFRREKRVGLSLFDHPIGLGLELTNALGGFLSCALYIGETYLDSSSMIKEEPYSWVMVCEVGFSVFFGLHFLLALFFAPFRVRFAYSFAGLVDMASVPYIFAFLCFDDTSSDAWSFWRYTRILRLQKAIDLVRCLHRVRHHLRRVTSEAKDASSVLIKTQLLQVVATLLAVIVYVAGLVELLASVEGPCEWATGKARAPATRHYARGERERRGVGGDEREGGWGGGLRERRSGRGRDGGHERWGGEMPSTSHPADIPTHLDARSPALRHRRAAPRRTDMPHRHANLVRPFGGRRAARA